MEEGIQRLPRLEIGIDKVLQVHLWGPVRRQRQGRLQGGSRRAFSHISLWRVPVGRRQPLRLRNSCKDQARKRHARRWSDILGFGGIGKREQADLVGKRLTWPNLCRRTGRGSGPNVLTLRSRKAVGLRMASHRALRQVWYRTRGLKPRALMRRARDAPVLRSLCYLRSLLQLLGCYPTKRLLERTQTCLGLCNIAVPLVSPCTLGSMPGRIAEGGTFNGTSSQTS